MWNVELNPFSGGTRSTVEEKATASAWYMEISTLEYREHP